MIKADYKKKKKYIYEQIKAFEKMKVFLKTKKIYIKIYINPEVLKCDYIII